MCTLVIVQTDSLQAGHGLEVGGEVGDAVLGQLALLHLQDGQLAQRLENCLQNIELVAQFVAGEVQVFEGCESSDERHINLSELSSTEIEVF